MAFLCPVRVKSNGNRKKKQNNESKKTKSFLSTVNRIISSEETAENNNVISPGRITGSSSIETIVRVGLEKEAGIAPEARCVVLHDFTPCVDDELEVKRGSVVSILYRENDWVYVLLEKLPNGVTVDDTREGFIPHSYCAPTTPDNNAELTNTTVPFYKDPSPSRYMALYKFTARDENDVNVERGEMLSVLNKDDPDWFYVVRADGQEGFVPSAFVYPTQQQPQQQSNQHTYQQIQHPTADAGGDPVSNTQQYGTELVMLYDYKAQAPDDLSVRRGDWVYADLLHQTVEGWLWAFAPKTRKYGFIPKAYARPPAMTSL